MSQGEEESEEEEEVEEDVHVDDATGEYEEAKEQVGRRDRALESGLIHLLMKSVPEGIMASKQRRNKKRLDLLERVQARVPSTGDEFWEYLLAQAYPWLYRQHTPSGHFVGVMPTRLYVAKRGLEDGFVMPERMSYEKMLGLEGPEPYDPVMRSYLFALNVARKMETRASVRYVKRGLRGALHHKESMKELSARFGDQILPGMPVSGSDVRTGVAELAALDKCEGPAAYFVTITLAMDRFPGIDDIWNAIVKHPDTNPSPHLPYLSRCWNRARQPLYEWIMLGEEHPFGNVRLVARKRTSRLAKGARTRGVTWGTTTRRSGRKIRSCIPIPPCRRLRARRCRHGCRQICVTCFVKQWVMLWRVTWCPSLIEPPVRGMRVETRSTITRFLALRTKETRHAAAESAASRVH